ncbi:hypothetical protein IFM89_014872 [Coptis chinensis]|uniref:Uncharacterized protein n=1 Tax=Coptis chinensis TaxID=261450 RepID=A0A835IC72_9MAGN|nr:hypothetical protein IFM89_014872 [Coptis chinensis]
MRSIMSMTQNTPAQDDQINFLLERFFPALQDLISKKNNPILEQEESDHEGSSRKRKRKKSKERTRVNAEKGKSKGPESNKVQERVAVSQPRQRAEPGIAFSNQEELEFVALSSGEETFDQDYQRIGQKLPVRRKLPAEDGVDFEDVEDDELSVSEELDAGLGSISGVRMSLQGSRPSPVSSGSRPVDGSMSNASEDSRQLGGDFSESSKQKKTVEFDADGQPVGDRSTDYVSFLGRITKKYCSIVYESFKDVTDQTRDLIWKCITDEYDVPESYRKCQFKKIAKCYREYKHRLRNKHYDKYDNDEDRRRNCPERVKQEDWEVFVRNESKPARKQIRAKAKAARNSLKAVHTSGRRGSARMVYDMKKKDPTANVTRTDSYMAINTCKDGSFFAPEKMTREPSSTQVQLQSHKNVSHELQRCELLNFHCDVVAKGRARRGEVFSDSDKHAPIDIYEVHVGIVFDPKERLFGSKMTFGELDPPATIKWPASFTHFV